MRLKIILSKWLQHLFIDQTCIISALKSFFKLLSVNERITASKPNTTLTHWPLGELAILSTIQFSNSWYKIVATRWFTQCSQVNITEPTNENSGNGLVPSGNKPLPEPMLTKIYAAIWHHCAAIYLEGHIKFKLFNLVEGTTLQLRHMSVMASQITSSSIVCSTSCYG